MDKREDDSRDPQHPHPGVLTLQICSPEEEKSMCEPVPDDALKRLHTLESTHWHGTFPQVVMAASRKYAWSHGCKDPDSAAGDAIAHLWEQLRKNIHTMTLESGALNEKHLVSWSSKVLDNKIKELKKRERPKAQFVQADLDVETLAAAIEDCGALNGSLLSTPFQRMSAREQQYKLLLLLSQELKRADLLLCRLAGFSIEQLGQNRTEPLARFSEPSVPVLTCKWRVQLLARLEKAPQPAGARALETNEDDLPLCTRQTPHLCEALCDLNGPKGTALLKVLMTRPSLERRRFLARLAGFWDSIIAAVWEESLETHRHNLITLRQTLEALLDSYPGGPTAAPPSGRSGDSDTMPDSYRSIPDAKHPKPSADDALRDVLEAEAIPPELAQLLQDLRRDPTLVESLRQGKRRWQQQAQACLTQPTQEPLFSGLWAQLKEVAEGLAAWLEPMPPNLAVVRRAAPAAYPLFVAPTPAASTGRQGRVTSPKIIDPRTGNRPGPEAQSIFVWRYVQGKLESLRASTGRPLRAQRVDTLPLMARAETESGPVTLFLVRLPESHPLHARLSPLGDSTGLSPQELETLLQAMLGAASRRELEVQFVEVS